MGFAGGIHIFPRHGQRAVFLAPLDLKHRHLLCTKRRFASREIAFPYSDKALIIKREGFVAIG